MMSVINTEQNIKKDSLEKSSKEVYKKCIKPIRNCKDIKSTQKIVSEKISVDFSKSLNIIYNFIIFNFIGASCIESFQFITNTEHSTIIDFINFFINAYEPDQSPNGFLSLSVIFLSFGAAMFGNKNYEKKLQKKMQKKVENLEKKQAFDFEKTTPRLTFEERQNVEMFFQSVKEYESLEYWLFRRIEDIENKTIKNTLKENIENSLKNNDLFLFIDNTQKMIHILESENILYQVNISKELSYLLSKKIKSFD
jgi:hypothetical protein